MHEKANFFLKKKLTGSLSSSDGTSVKCTLWFGARNRWSKVHWPMRVPPEWIGVEAGVRHRKGVFHTKALEVWKTQQIETREAGSDAMEEIQQSRLESLPQTLAVSELFVNKADDLEINNQDPEPLLWDEEMNHGDDYQEMRGY